MVPPRDCGLGAAFWGLVFAGLAGLAFVTCAWIWMPWGVALGISIVIGLPSATVLAGAAFSG